jgi:hypothetical protein
MHGFLWTKSLVCVGGWSFYNYVATDYVHLRATQMRIYQSVKNVQEVNSF